MIVGRLARHRKQATGKACRTTALTACLPSNTRSPHHMLPWLTLTALAGDSAPAQSALLSGAVDAPAALSVLQAQGPEVSSAEDVQYALEHGWWEPAKHMLRTMRERGDAVTTMQSVRTTATRIRDEATEVINLLRVSALRHLCCAATALPPRSLHAASAASALPQRCLVSATAPPLLRRYSATALPPRGDALPAAVQLVTTATAAPRVVRARAGGRQQGRDRC